MARAIRGKDMRSTKRAAAMASGVKRDDASPTQVRRQATAFWQMTWHFVKAKAVRVPCILGGTENAVDIATRQRRPFNA